MAKHSKKQTITVRPFNPFSVSLEGVTLLFSRAQSVGLFLILFIVATAMINFLSPQPEFTKDPSGKSTEKFMQSALQAPPEVILTWVAIIAVISVFVLVVTTMLHGISSYTALQLSKGYEARLGEAFNAVLNNFGRYLIMYFIMNIKIFLWTMLFIIPGIVAYYRYNFSGMIFFDEDKKLRGLAAIAESSRLTKKGVLALYASQFLPNVITLFYADRIITLSSQAVLYREYTALDKAKAEKPKAHIVSKLALALPFIMIFLFLVLSVLLFSTGQTVQ